MSTNPLVRNYETYSVNATLDGLHLHFNFRKIRFINDGFITKKNFVTKSLEKCFWPLAQKLGIGSNNNCTW